MASGTGSLARTILAAVKSGELELSVIGLISDKHSPALKVAADFGVPTIVLPVGKDRSAWDASLLAIASELNPDLIVSVGFMRILAPALVEKFIVINTHPSLLPNFPGAHAVRDALAAGVQETGCTVHRVDAGMDTGPVIASRSVAIKPGVSESDLHKEIKIVERALIVEVLKRYATEGIL